METSPFLLLESEIFLSVVIPAYQEERRIGGTLRQIQAYLQEYPHPSEILVVDDGSRDHTAQRAEEVLRGVPRAQVLRSAPNRGKGHAVRLGVLATRGRYVLFTDADLSTPLAFTGRLIRELQGGADVVMGSRGLPGSRIVVAQPLYRRLAARVFNRLRDATLGTCRFVDTQCGFKAFRGNLARFLFSQGQVEGFMFDVEVLHLAARLGCRIQEVPVDWADAPGSQVRVVRDTVRMVRDLAAIRRNHRDFPSGAIYASGCAQGRLCPLRSPGGGEAAEGCAYPRCPVVFQEAGEG